MNARPVVYRVVDGVATLTLDDPLRMNPLSRPMLEGCLDALACVRADPSVRVLVIEANGAAFSGGADVRSFGELLAQGDADGDPHRVGAHITALLEELGTPFVLGMAELPVPTVSVVRGAVAGGGVGFALAADVVVAARSAYFYLPFAPVLGLIPDLAAVWSMRRTAGRARSMGLSLLGERLSADDAQRWGLVWSCVDDDRLADETARIAGRLAALPTGSALEVRRLHREAEHNTLERQLAHEAVRQGQLADGAAFRAGVGAFVARSAKRAHDD